jgi:acetyl esterase
VTIDPSLLPAVERHRAAWPIPGHALPLKIWRERYEAVVAAARPKRPPGVSAVDRIVGDGDTRVRIYRPDQPDVLPALVYFHGGGWVIGSIESHDDITAAVSNDAGCIVVSVEYSRAPEHPFPAAFEEGRSVLRWVETHAAEIGADPTRLFVAGDSAGGNLAAAMALAAVDHGPTLAGQLLLYPCLDTDFTRASYRHGREAPFLSSGEMQWFWDQYAVSPEARANCFAVPMRAGDACLRRVASAFIATAEHDPLHNEGAAFAARLKCLGVEVQYEPGTGLVHGFVRLRAEAPEPERIYRAMCKWIRQRSALPDVYLASSSDRAGLPSSRLGRSRRCNSAGHADGLM